MQKQSLQISNNSSLGTGEKPKMKKQYLENYQSTWHDYYQKIEKFCAYHLKSSPDSVEDCCQEVFFSYWRVLENGQEIQNVQAWLYKVAYNQIKKIQKQMHILPKVNALDEIKDLEMATEIDFIEEMLKNRFQDEELIQLVKETLTEEEQYIFDGCFLKGKDTAEMAKELGIQVNYLYKKKWSLKQKLSKKVHMVLTQAVNELLKK